MTGADLNPEGLALNETQLVNLSHLLQVCNLVEAAYGKKLVVNRGVSSPADQARIDPRCPHDAHVLAAGVDFADPDKELQAWWLRNVPLAVDLGIYFEDFGYTPAHVHCQTYPPKSGHRFFIP